MILRMTPPYPFLSFSISIFLITRSSFTDFLIFVKVMWIRVGKMICFRWIDHGLEIRAISSIGGNKRGVRRHFFHFDTIDLSGNLILTKDLLSSEWKEIEIREPAKRMYEGIRIDQVISENDLRLIKRLLRSYD